MWGEITHFWSIFDWFNICLGGADFYNVNIFYSLFDSPIFQNTGDWCLISLLIVLPFNFITDPTNQRQLQSSSTQSTSSYLPHWSSLMPDRHVANIFLTTQATTKNNLYWPENKLWSDIPNCMTKVCWWFLEADAGGAHCCAHPLSRVCAKMCERHFFNVLTKKKCEQTSKFAFFRVN